MEFHFSLFISLDSFVSLNNLIFLMDLADMCLLMTPRV